MIAQVADRAKQIKEYYFSTKLNQIRELNASGIEVVNLGIGNPDMPPHPTVIQKLAGSSTNDAVHGYQPYKGIPSLRKAISGFYSKHFNVSVDPETEILPLIGSKEGIMHISMTFLNRGDAVLVPDPGYPAYAAAAKMCGARCIYYDLTAENDWLPDLQHLQKEDLQSVKIMWVNYPNMPTGRKADKGLFDELISFGIKNNILIVNDNPYSFILNNRTLSILSAANADGNALELNSLSKSHNMAGWRIGMVLGNEELISNIIKIKSNMDSGMFLPVQEAAVTAMSLGEKWFSGLNAVYAERKKLVMKLLSILGCKCNSKQSGMFIWAEIPSEQMSSIQFTDYILEKYRIFITPGSIFGSNGQKYIRISLCTPEEKLIECINRIK